ncbi:MAG: ATP-binding protein [Mycobacteriales bacterium]
MAAFRGRAADLSLLEQQLRQVVRGKGGRRGRAAIVTGRRRVGKSRLVQEFCDRSGLPCVIFQATPGRDTVAGSPAADWNQALEALACAVPDHTASIAVIDEVPWLVEQDPGFAGALRTVWDRHLSVKPVLLLLVGSDLPVMEALQLAGRTAKLTVDPLHLADVQAMTELPAAEAVDALLLTGGFPEVVRAWEPGMGLRDYLRQELADALSPLLTVGELSMLGEFPTASRTRAVLEAIGTGERTFTGIAAGSGERSPIPSGTLAPILNTLLGRRLVAADLPLSTRPDTRNKRYRVADTYLRFWLAFLNRGIGLVERGRGDLLLERVERSWTSWRGRAVEPIVRESLARLLPDGRWAGTDAVGGWWNRRNRPVIDLVGVDREPVAGQVCFVGAIKWLENRPFGRRDYDDLARDLLAVPGAEPGTPLVAVSRGGFAEDLPLAARWGPDDLLRAWQR